jgi:hypothetical protein
MLAVAVLAVALAAQPGAALARASYDTPTAIFDESGYFEITLQVQAGPSGTPGGFVIEWMTQADFDRLGGWPADDNDPAVARCAFEGAPTLNLDPASASFQLAPDGSIHVQIGDLFDETGVSATHPDQIPPGTQFVFRVRATGTSGVADSDPSALVSATTLTPPECTQGFWKTHPERWPEGCTPMTLGTVSYTKAQLLDILNSPAQGNGLLSLAHQLISVKLNLCNGSDPTAVAGDIASADALIGGLIAPPVGSGQLAPSATSALTETLDQYNNGKIGGVANCPTPVLNRTWGALKASYR